MISFVRVVDWIKEVDFCMNSAFLINAVQSKKLHWFCHSISSSTCVCESSARDVVK